VWEHSLLEQLLPATFVPLPKRASFRVAIRRTTRAKDRAGMPVDRCRSRRMSDTHVAKGPLEGNTDLIAKALSDCARRRSRPCQRRSTAQSQRSTNSCERDERLAHRCCMKVVLSTADREGRPRSFSPQRSRPSAP
jgi:hypothetical protein